MLGWHPLLGSCPRVPRAGIVSPPLLGSCPCVPRAVKPCWTPQSSSQAPDFLSTLVSHPLVASASSITSFLLLTSQKTPAGFSQSWNCVTPAGQLSPCPQSWNCVTPAGQLSPCPQSWNCVTPAGQLSPCPQSCQTLLNTPKLDAPALPTQLLLVSHPLVAPHVPRVLHQFSSEPKTSPAQKTSAGFSQSWEFCHPCWAAVPVSPELSNPAGHPKALPRLQISSPPSCHIPWWHQGLPSAQLCSSPPKNLSRIFPELGIVSPLLGSCPLVPRPLKPCWTPQSSSQVPNFPLHPGVTSPGGIRVLHQLSPAPHLPKTSAGFF
ncbi:uncharacterized protein LOC132337978 isoform X2 [Haemorhous mexicanus]|uniref:uncharacterized protein LOC132337978 isoform X2 n=1 Tax=Haemorhous mexicanus TaxID=30427 RepID=UPI0028BF58C4|nr:uncharacterized protein LOC132337978 isoform X2 [Haemorhous mexicanus]